MKFSAIKKGNDFISEVPDSAEAVCWEFDTEFPITSAGAILGGFYNNGSLVFAVNKDGGFAAFGTTPPTSQPLKINDPTGGATTDAEARTAINAIIDVLEGAGLASST